MKNVLFYGADNFDFQSSDNLYKIEFAFGEIHYFIDLAFSVEFGLIYGITDHLNVHFFKLSDIVSKDIVSKNDIDWNSLVKRMEDDLT